MEFNLPKKRYYSIGELAKAFQVNASLIRFWEGEFDILKPKKNNKGNRLFTTKDVENLKIIYRLVKENGYTLEGAKKKLRVKKETLITNNDVITRLENIKQELVKIKKQLNNPL